MLVEVVDLGPVVLLDPAEVFIQLDSETGSGLEAVFFKIIQYRLQVSRLDQAFPPAGRIDPSYFGAGFVMARGHFAANISNYVS